MNIDGGETEACQAEGGRRKRRGLAGIEAIVARMVEQRVRATVAKAVRALEGATTELRQL